jgi:hypothetical protein
MASETNKVASDESVVGQLKQKEADLKTTLASKLEEVESIKSKLSAVQGELQVRRLLEQDVKQPSDIRCRLINGAALQYAKRNAAMLKEYGVRLFTNDDIELHIQAELHGKDVYKACKGGDTTSLEFESSEGEEALTVAKNIDRVNTTLFGEIDVELHNDTNLECILVNSDDVTAINESDDPTIPTHIWMRVGLLVSPKLHKKITEATEDVEEAWANHVPMFAREYC